MLRKLAIIVVFVLLYIHPLQPQTPAQYGNHHANASAQQEPTPSVVVKIDNRVGCEECGKKDSIAPQDPDKWVRRGFWINAVLVFITLVIAIAALIQAIAAKNAVDLSRSTAKKQLRAYLCVEEACVKITENVIIEGKYWAQVEGQVYVKNGGQTPAYAVRTWIFGSIRSYPESIPVPPPPEGLPRSTAIIPAQGKPHFVPAKEIVITPQAMESLQSPNVAYYVQGEVHYRDIFKDWHCLKVRMFFGGPAGTRTKQDANGLILGHLVPDSWGNSDEDESDPDKPEKAT